MLCGPGEDGCRQRGRHTQAGGEAAVEASMSTERFLQ